MFEDQENSGESRELKRRKLERRRAQQMRRRRARIMAVLLLAVIVVVLAVIISKCSSSASGTDDAAASSPAETEESEKQEPVEIDLMCAGDIMAHSPNLRSAYNASTGTYDFNDNYDYVKKYIESADLAMANMETTFAGGTPQGYPLFNAPDELASAVAGAGFDVAFTSNNHMLDTGFDGMQRTLKVLRDQGLTTEGSRYDGENNYQVVDVRGVKVGLVGYTFETTAAAGAKETINGNYVSDQAAELINSFNYHELETGDYAKIQKSIDSARDDGAQMVICYLHWGTEYERTPNSQQTAMAQKIADMGADVIFASHPHVIQKIDVLNSADGNNVPVFYSLGNFISNQRTETLKNRYTEQEIIGRVKLTYDPEAGKITAENVSAIPLWVDKYGSPVKFAIVPLDSDLTGNQALAASGHLSRAQQALSDVTDLLGQKYIDGVDVSAEKDRNGDVEENEAA